VWLGRAKKTTMLGMDLMLPAPLLWTQSCPLSHRLLFESSCGFVPVGGELGVKGAKRLSVSPFQVIVFAARDRAYPSLRLVEPDANLGLRKAGLLNIRYECLPVHGDIIRMLFSNVNSYLIAFCISMLIWKH
jgi:hypothetical protein